MSIASYAHAEVTAANPIDLHMRACQARIDSSSTADQVQCMNAAREAWQIALERAYKQLLAKVTRVQRRHWIISQRRWSAWNKAENPLLAAVFSPADNDNTIFAQSEADIRLQTVRDRALLLRAQITLADTRKLLPHSGHSYQADMRYKHASRELNRYYHSLSVRLLPARARVMLAHAQHAWYAYRNATIPLIDANARIDLTGAQLAALKRLSDAVGYR